VLTVTRSKAFSIVNALPLIHADMKVRITYTVSIPGAAKNMVKRLMTIPVHVPLFLLGSSNSKMISYMPSYGYAPPLPPEEDQWPQVGSAGFGYYLNTTLPMYSQLHRLYDNIWDLGVGCLGGGVAVPSHTHLL